MSLVDISEMKQSMEHMQEQHLFMDAVFETLRESLLLLTPDLKVERANRAYYERFHTTPRRRPGTTSINCSRGNGTIRSCAGCLMRCFRKSPHLIISSCR